jgi:hypothetical protein
MARQALNLGIAYGDGLGDKLRDAGVKIEANFADLYTRTFNPMDYGAVGTGLVDDSPAVNLCVAAALLVGGKVVFPAGYRWRFDGPINLTFPPGGTTANYRPVWLCNEGSTGLGNDLATCNFIINHAGHAFDCCGGYDLIFENIGLQTPPGVFPLTGWFCARNSTGGGSGHHRWMNCRAWGNFDEAVIYAYGSEQLECDQGTYFTNLSSGASCVVVTQNNIHNRSSSFATVATGTLSTTVYRFNGNFEAQNAGGDVFYLEGARDVRIDGWMRCGSSAADGRSLIYVDGTNAATNNVQIKNVIGENAAFLPAYGITFSNHTRNHGQFTVQDWRATTRTRAILAPALVTLSGLQIDQFLEVGTTTGIEIQGTITDSWIHCDRTLILNVADKVVLWGDPSNWTITSPTNVLYVDTAHGGFARSVNFTGTGQVIQGVDTATLNRMIRFKNLSADMLIGIEGSLAGQMFTGGAAYSTCLGSGGAKPLHLGTDSAVRATIDATGGTQLLGAFAANGATPQTKATVNAAATDLPTAIALLNQVRALLIANGQAQ